MEGWLKQRLTPAKAKQPRWTSLAEALEELWVKHFDPLLSRLERLRSSYSADDADLDRKLHEMGDYFTYDLPKVADRPVTLAWRRLELQNKDVEYIIRSVFRRHFGHFPVYWLPLFAPKGSPYGTAFTPFEGLEDVPAKNLPPDGMFLTSRGVLGVDRLGLLANHMDKAVFRDRVIPLIRRTKPLHIVFDGCLWFIRYQLPFESSFFVDYWETDDQFSLLFAPAGSRFDFTAADKVPLDTSVLSLKKDWERHIELLFIRSDFPLTWRLDLFPSDGLPEAWFRLDLSLHGYEGMVITPLFNVRGTSRLVSFTLTEAAFKLAWEVRRAYRSQLEVELTRNAITEQRHNFAFWQKHEYRLDDFFREGFTDGLVPLDARFLYTENDTHIPFFLLYGDVEHRHAFTWTAPPARQNAVSSHTTRQVLLSDFSFELSMQRNTDSPYNVPHPYVIPSLDQQPLFDEIPADFMPVDYTYGGYTNA